MIRKNLKKAFTKNYRFDGFTLTELVVGMLIVAIASLAIFTGVSYLQSGSHTMRLKERAYEELKSYTELWKGRIAAGDISEGDLSYSKEVCLDLKPQPNIGQCINRANIYANINIIDTENSKAKRTGVKTRIVWKTVYGANQELDFYVEQMLFN